MASQKRSASVLIIGAGVSGLCTAIDMIRRNKSHDFLIVEKGSQIGGTWNDNKYPGCCCDVWSHLYSYSFEQNSEWTREYPGQEEILSHLIKVAQKWGLYQYIQFNTEVEEARWNETSQKWETLLKVTGGKAAEYVQSYSFKSDFLVSAVGQLNMPQYPSISGLESFQGKVMHSARWDWGYEMEGKKVAIIGNGATAAQIIPEVVKVAKSLTVFQRTPNWVIPRDDKVITDTMRWVYRNIPAIRKWYRALLMDIREDFFVGAFVENSQMNALFQQLSIDMMKRQIPNNEALWKSLTPDYPAGCKRVILSDDFYPALAQPHVKLETRPIEEITTTGVKSGDYNDFDLIVLATGFRTVEFMCPIKIYGVGGRSLDDIWKGGARAYLGMTVDSLPNFAMLYGPNTNLGHNSIILMIEAQSRYINTLISPIIKSRATGGTLAITPKTERVASYNDEIQSRLQKSTFANANCRSWYKNADGLVTNNWCGTVVEYQILTSSVDWNDYAISGSNKGEVSCQGKKHIGRIVEETTYSATTLMTSAASAAVILAGLAYRYGGHLKTW